MQDHSLFAFAGIWDRWKPPQGPIVETCAIVTTAPNELLQDVHDRMPVILKPDKYKEWLDAPASDCARLKHLLIPFDAAVMRRFPVGLSVNNGQNDTPECVQEVPEFTSAQAALF